LGGAYPPGSETGVEPHRIPLVVPEHEERLLLRESLQRIDQPEGPGGAAKLTVGYRVEAHFLLHVDRFDDASLQDFPVRFLAKLPVTERGKSALEFFGSQQAADMLGPERRIELHVRRHNSFPSQGVGFGASLPAARGVGSRQIFFGEMPKATII
jgi:hypothetical protein